MSNVLPLDLENRLQADDHTSLRLWLRLLSTSIRIEDTIRQRLREGFGITLPRFDLMAQLEREPEGLTMGELSRRMMVTGGNVTTIVDQLTKEDLVQRVTLTEDRRSYRVTMTPVGRAAFAGMARAHEQWVKDLMAGLDEHQQHQLHHLLGVLKHGLVTSTSTQGQTHDAD
jgi:DNA-binding MarR family transcriptional regulator